MSATITAPMYHCLDCTEKFTTFAQANNHELAHEYLHITVPELSACCGAQIINGFCADCREYA
jgi:hypothetical protein